jgi:hypothetical protein
MTNPTPAAEVATDEHYCLAEVDLFRDLSRREMAALVTGAPQRTVSAGQVVYSPLRPTAVLFIVKRGRIRLHHLTPDGAASPLRSSAPAPSSARWTCSACACAPPGPKRSNPASCA